MSVWPFTSKARTGSVFVEAVIALTIVLVAMMASAQLIAVTVRQQHELEDIRIATNEVANVMERLYGTPWKDLLDRDEPWNDLSDAARDRLTEPEFRVLIETTKDAIASKRCRVEASWIDQSGNRVQPIQLTAWKHFLEDQ